MACLLGKSDFDFAVTSAPCMENGAAAAVTMRINQVFYFAGNSGENECIDNESALPPPVRLDLPMLGGAASA